MSNVCTQWPPAHGFCSVQYIWIFYNCVDRSAVGAENKLEDRAWVRYIKRCRLRRYVNFFHNSNEYICSTSYCTNRYDILEGLPFLSTHLIDQKPYSNIMTLMYFQIPFSSLIRNTLPNLSGKRIHLSWEYWIISYINIWLVKENTTNLSDEFGIRT